MGVRGGGPGADPQAHTAPVKAAAATVAAAAASAVDVATTVDGGRVNHGGQYVWRLPLLAAMHDVDHFGSPVRDRDAGL